MSAEETQSGPARPPRFTSVNSTPADRAKVASEEARDEFLALQEDARTGDADDEPFRRLMVRAGRANPT